MAISPELPRPEAQVTEIPAVPELPPEVEHATGAKVVQKNFTAQVKSDKGIPLISTPPTQVIAVTPPADPAALTAWGKGPISASITWLGLFWIRILKKAAHFGWQVTRKEGT